MTSDSATSSPTHARPEPHAGSLAGRLNWLRAGVLGANDGIVSVAAIVVGVASANAPTAAIVAAGSAALVGGAISMALGEYVSVSSQRDSQQALIEKERAELHDDPAGELDELTDLYRAQGLSDKTARQVAVELTEKNALKAHLAMELNLDENDIASPWAAAGASALSFVVGGILPLLAILLPPTTIRVPLTFAVVIVALAATGITGAVLGESRVVRATLRVVIGGALALAATFVIGSLLGTSGIG
ncbi:VIT1/CCC1 transporter family protein [Subtercola endophyticus]|uniref:VIT1/CCC1 transporter family protein n=1 Tax=Subtercola endophyticus TaxID=2895559 RepID=UPI001E5BBFA2|nr:VIT family protein [Subtercola endophyticus]UFS59126.1 VIT family protein [Subtercola endophyticus]